MQTEALEDLRRDRPVRDAGDVGQQEAYVLPTHPRRHEEVLGDGHEPNGPDLARLLAQDMQERVEIRAGPSGERGDLPLTVLPDGRDGEVDRSLVHGGIVADGGQRRAGRFQTRTARTRRGGPLGTLTAMRTLVVDHPLVAHKLTSLRDERTDSPTFRRLADELVTLLAYEATREVRTVPHQVRTPVAEAAGVRLSIPKPLVVPILRAGLGMLDGMVRLLPTAEVGFLGMVRDENTLTASTYANRIPDDLTSRQCYVLDPMLATGGTLIAAIRLLLDRGAHDVTAICLLAAPEGLVALEESLGAQAPVHIVMAGLDDHLNEKGYIVPGLGDAGDRLYGVV